MSKKTKKRKKAVPAAVPPQCACGSGNILDDPDVPDHIKAALTAYHMNVCDVGREPYSKDDFERESIALFSSIERTLLEIGGHRVVRQNILHFATHLSLLGELFDEPVRLRLGEPSMCHYNAARIWAADVDAVDIASGYALSPDGLWRVHTWLIDDTSIIETTVKREKYYGFLLSPEEAAEAWFRWYLAEKYPGPMSILLPCQCDGCHARYFGLEVLEPQPCGDAAPSDMMEVAAAVLKV